MDFIKKFIEEHSKELTDNLTSSGFSVEQAKQFLPEAASGIMSVSQNHGVDKLVTAFSSGQQDDLLSMVNIDNIASRVGIDVSQVISGFESIIPVITDYFSQKSGGLGGALSSLAAGSADDLLGSVKKLWG